MRQCKSIFSILGLFWLCYAQEIRAASLLETSQTAYDVHQLQKDLVSLLSLNGQQGVYSGQYLGNPQHIVLWQTADGSPNRYLYRLYMGIAEAHRLFYSYFSLQDFARLVLSEGMKESTGDYLVGYTTAVTPSMPLDLENDHASYGFIQATPASVVQEYAEYGEAIYNVDGVLLLHPACAKSIDLSDPTSNILLWAWYTHNSLLLGESITEWQYRLLWFSKPSTVRADYGNAMYTWLGGPRNDRHTLAGSKDFSDYYLSVLDYWVASGFGSRAQYDALLDTLIPYEFILLKDLSKPTLYHH